MDALAPTAGQVGFDVATAASLSRFLFSSPASGGNETMFR
jgi:hypothetical protein